MLAHRVPFPPDRGDRVRSWNLLRFLARHYDVSLVCVSEEPVTDAQWDALRSVAERCVVRKIRPTWSRVRGVASLAAGGAATPGAFYREDLRDTILSWHEATPFDAVLTYCTGMFRYAHELTSRDDFQARGGRHVLDLVDVDSEKWAQLAPLSSGVKRWVYGREAKALRVLERGDVGRVDAITVVSAREAQLYAKVVREDARLAVVENGVDLSHWSPLPDCEERALGFVGVLDYEPNVLGLRWFVDEVMPLVRERSPSARMRIVGRRPNEAVRRLAREPGVELVGEVADVRPELAKCAAVVAPLRIARGVQNKVLEAMACARAVVCTTQVAEGVDAWAGRELLVADEPRRFAEACALVLADAWRRKGIATMARKRIEERYRWEATLAPMMDLLAGGPRRAVQPLAA